MLRHTLPPLTWIGCIIGLWLITQTQFRHFLLQKRDSPVSVNI